MSESTNQIDRAMARKPSLNLDGGFAGGMGRVLMGGRVGQAIRRVTAGVFSEGKASVIVTESGPVAPSPFAATARFEARR